MFHHLTLVRLGDDAAAEVHPSCVVAFATHPAHDDLVARHVQPYADTVMSVDYDDEAITAPASPDERSQRWPPPRPR